MDFKIRKTTREDVSSILKLIQELADFEKEPEAVEISEEDLLQDGFQENPLFTCFVAEINQTVVGMALCYFRYSTWKGKTVHLEDLIVQQNFRGKGIGKALYKKTLQFAVENNVKRVEWVVLNWNKNAVDFYKNSGASVFKEWNTVQFEEKAFKNYLNRKA
ncbi:GNAT family N-acetyltransferase [Mesonia maritima]|uniref:N-acetyltransferase domain-containing protein n=1 Tax=Mesonia maritima TaxID=1793873 RepID=A0ABU1K356_9FLAO|nr:GNAT family N-acetyltransferase [Mesonia maritima]MDR6300039.1 hypothetical protein [Mesonia maritima]